MRQKGNRYICLNCQIWQINFSSASKVSAKLLRLKVQVEPDEYRAGRPRMTTPRDDRRIVRLVQKNMEKSL